MRYTLDLGYPLDGDFNSNSFLWNFLRYLCQNLYFGDYTFIIRFFKRSFDRIADVYIAVWGLGIFHFVSNCIR